jgi:hypothetical protein
MNEPDLQALERRLHTLPPLLDVPQSLVAASVQAAVAEADSPAATRPVPRRARGWSRRWSLAGVVAIAAAAAVAVTITVTSQSGGHPGFQRIATLTGAGKRVRLRRRRARRRRRRARRRVHQPPRPGAR